ARAIGELAKSNKHIHAKSARTYSHYSPRGVRSKHSWLRVCAASIRKSRVLTREKRFPYLLDLNPVFVGYTRIHERVEPPRWRLQDRGDRSRVQTRERRFVGGGPIVLAERVPNACVVALLGERDALDPQRRTHEAVIADLQSHPELHRERAREH